MLVIVDVAEYDFLFHRELLIMCAFIKVLLLLGSETLQLEKQTVFTLRTGETGGCFGVLQVQCLLKSDNMQRILAVFLRYL
jgi:hypothetical protein